jgi:hypothetical protein
MREATCRLLLYAGILAAFCDTVVGLHCFWIVQSSRDQKKAEAEEDRDEEFP